MNCAKTTESIEMPFGADSHGSKEPCIRRGPDRTNPFAQGPWHFGKIFLSLCLINFDHVTTNALIKLFRYTRMDSMSRILINLSLQLIFLYITHVFYLINTA